MFVLLILFYFLDFGQFIYTVIGVLAVLVLELWFLLKSDALNLVIPTSGENWKKFEKSFLYDLSNINPFFRMIIKRGEHDRLLSMFKRKSLYVLRRFSLLEIPDVQRVVETFESASDDERIMIGELANEVDKLGINKDLFELFYYESALKDNGEILQEIKNKNDEFQWLLQPRIKMDFY